MIDVIEETAQLKKQLQAVSNSSRAVGEKKYLKSSLQFIGVTTPDKRKIAKHWLKSHPDVSKVELLNLVNHLWDTPIFELRSIGIELLKARATLLTLEDLSLIETMIHSTQTWAELDVIATDIVGIMLEQYPTELKPKLREWITSKNFWVRRTAILAQNKAFSRGEGDFKFFSELVVSQLDESPNWTKEEKFFIRKAIGWALRTRATSPAYSDVVTFVNRYKDKMSGLTYREATRRLPKGVL